MNGVERARTAAVHRAQSTCPRSSCCEGDRQSQFQIRNAASGRSRRHIPSGPRESSRCNISSVQYHSRSSVWRSEVPIMQQTTQHDPLAAPRPSLSGSRHARDVQLMPGVLLLPSFHRCSCRCSIIREQQLRRRQRLVRSRRKAHGPYSVPVVQRDTNAAGPRGRATRQKRLMYYIADTGRRRQWRTKKSHRPLLAPPGPASLGP